VTIYLSDKRGVEPKESKLHYEGGLEQFVRYLDRAKNSLIPAPVMVMAEREGIVVEAALTWNDSYHESMLIFTNNIPQRDGGTHLAGFRAALTRVVTKYAGEMAGKKDRSICRATTAARADLRLVGKGAGPEILVANEGQAGFLRGAPGG